MATPTLNPPCPGWQEDLPGPYAQPIHKPGLAFNEFNCQDEIYFEFSRPLLAIRGIMFAGGVFLFYLSHSLYSMTAESTLKIDSTIIISAIITIIFGMASSILFFKLDLAPPRDLPIRFNRARQRIYAYNYKWCWWNPFARWRVTPVAYDWSQVRAERWARRGATMHGVILKWGVELAIVKPGTNEVIDRFPFSTMGGDQHAWAYACLYMQQGPSAVPTPKTSRDANDVSSLNPGKWLAPKVKWPADMDVESRTAP